MKFIGLAASLSFSLLASSVWATSVNVDSVNIEIVDTPNQKWEFHRVMASENNGALIISGRLNASLVVPRPNGHVDVAAYSPSGEKLAETTTRYVPTLLSPKLSRKGGVRFSATLPGTLPPGTVVKVAFHADTINQAAPSHTVNIAR